MSKVSNNYGRVISFMALNQGCTLADIAKGLGIDKRTVKKVVAQLTRDHYIDPRIYQEARTLMQYYCK